MASRVIEAGSVVARTRFLLSTRVLKERPLWLDVAEAFPPVEPLPPPHKDRQLHSGKAKTLSFTEDCLRRDFLKHYSIVTKAGLTPAEEVYSLYEGKDQNTPNLIDLFVREQNEKISLGKSQEEAGLSAVAAVSDVHPTLTVQPREKEAAKETKPEDTTPLEKVVFDVLESLK